jgi:hypothetical protein
MPPTNAKRPSRPRTRPVAVIGPGWVQIRADDPTKYDRRAIDVRTAWDALRIADAVPLAHPVSAVQMWVLAEHVTALGLEYRPDPNLSRKRQRADIEKHLAKAGQAFVDAAIERGWTLQGKGLGARATFSRTDVDGKLRSVVIVLEPYQWLLDSKGSGVTGEDGTPTELDLDPEIRAAQIIRRVEVVDELLGVLPLATPALAATKLLDRDQYIARAAQNRGASTTDAAGRKRHRVLDQPGVIPKLDGRAGIAAEVFPAIGWWRQPTADEIKHATFAVQLDQRWAYPYTCNELWVGYGAPRWADRDEANDLAMRLATDTDRKIFALWRSQPPTWDERRIFPPHPDLANANGPLAWLFPPTLKILTGDPDAFGGGFDLDTLDISGAWVWPESGQVLQRLYKAAKACWDYTSDPEHQKADPVLTDWLRGFGKTAVRAAVGRYASPFAAADAESGGKPWWQAQRLFSKHFIWPIQAATDSLTYLVDDEVFAALDEADDGRLGILKIDKVELFAAGDQDELRAELAELKGRSPNRVLWPPKTAVAAADVDEGQDHEHVDEVE